MISKLFDNTAILEKAVEASWLRNEAIANNLANIDTPGYKRRTVEFESFLAEALDQKKIMGHRTHEKHMPIGKQDLNNISIKQGQDHSENEMRIDGNNVDIDAETALFLKNNIYYNAVIQQLSGRFSSIKTVLRETK